MRQAESSAGFRHFLSHLPVVFACCGLLPAVSLCLSRGFAYCRFSLLQVLHVASSCLLQFAKFAASSFTGFSLAFAHLESGAIYMLGDSSFGGSSLWLHLPRSSFSKHLLLALSVVMGG